MEKGKKNYIKAATDYLVKTEDSDFSQINPAKVDDRKKKEVLNEAVKNANNEIFLDSVINGGFRVERAFGIAAGEPDTNVVEIVGRPNASGRFFTKKLEVEPQNRFKTEQEDMKKLTKGLKKLLDNLDRDIMSLMKENGYKIG